jgi:hypothetical protein
LATPKPEAGTIEDSTLPFGKVLQGWKAKSPQKNVAQATGQSVSRQEASDSDSRQDQDLRSNDADAAGYVENIVTASVDSGASEQNDEYAPREGEKEADQSEEDATMASLIRSIANIQALTQKPLDLGAETAPQQVHDLEVPCLSVSSSFFFYCLFSVSMRLLM